MIFWLVAAGAVVLAAGAATLRLAPSRIYGLAAATTLVTLIFTTHAAGESCSAGGLDLAVTLVEITSLLSLTLYGAAALVGMIDGFRVGMEGRHDAAFLRFVGWPVASAVGVAIVAYAFLLGIAHCLD